MYHYLELLKHKFSANFFFSFFDYVFFACLIYQCNIKNTSNILQTTDTYLSQYHVYSHLRTMTMNLRTMVIKHDVNGLKTLLWNYANRSDNNWQFVYGMVAGVDHHKNTAIHIVSDSDILKQILGILFFLANGDVNKLEAIAEFLKVKNEHNANLVELAALNGRKDLLATLFNLLNNVLNKDLHKDLNINALNDSIKQHIENIIQCDIVIPAIGVLQNHMRKHHNNNKNIQDAIDVIKDYLNKDKNRVEEDKKILNSSDIHPSWKPFINNINVLMFNELSRLHGCSSHAANNRPFNPANNIGLKSQRIEKTESKHQCKWAKCRHILSNHHDHCKHVNEHVANEKRKRMWYPKGKATSSQTSFHGLHLKEYVRIHRGAKPFKCNNCNKAFMHMGNLKRHILIHMAVKPFKCDNCNKTFTQVDNLKRHIRIHTGAKPFKCVHQDCGRAFSRKDYLNIHIQSHRG